MPQRVRQRWFVVAALAGIVVGGIAGEATLRWFVPDLDAARMVSTSVVDRDGRLLRAFTLADGRWRLPVDTLNAVDPRYIALLIASEDRRFRSHPGVDLLALARAAYQLGREGHIVSGGSTLTMQMARLLAPRGERSLRTKIAQIIRAMALERALDKDAILNLYLTHAPFGGNLEGVRAASLAYFGKEPKRLSLAEAALLVALPQSPETRRPDRFGARARVARDRVIDRAVRAGLVADDEAAQARAEVVPNARHPMPLAAPHLAAYVVARSPKSPIITTTLDGSLQRTLEALARERMSSLGAQVTVAMLALDHHSGAVLARLGGADYFDLRRSGQVDMTRALRSPGSTLKPFIYGLAFEDGLVHPETLIDDRPARFGTYAPVNFDMTYQGTVSVARALQFSLNVPAVALLERVGAGRFATRLKAAGGALVLPVLEAPGLAMGLGGVGVTLETLVGLYGGLARQGNTVMPFDHGEPLPPRRLLEPVAASYVAKVLLGTPPPNHGVAGRIAFKTGTSYGFRDAWAVGFDGHITIGVWVGRPDGAPSAGLSGRVAAAPLLFDAFARLGRPIAPLPKPPAGLLNATNAGLPAPLRRFLPHGALTGSHADAAPHIQFPYHGARIERLRDGDVSTIAVKVAGGSLPLTVYLDGRPAVALANRRQAVVPTPEGGFTRLTVTDAQGRVDSVLIRLE